MSISPTARIKISGARGPRGFASGPLGADSVGAEEIKDDSGAQADIRNKLDLTSSTELAAPTGSAGLGFIQSGAGAVARTVQSKLRETASVADFGAAGDGVTDDTAAITAAIAHVKGAGGTLVFPGGTYLVSTVTFDGSDYNVDTSAGVTFKQKPGVASATPFVIHIVTAKRLRIGFLSVIGNIGTDTGEDHHGVALSRCQDVRIDGVFGTDIRGDVLYSYARTDEGEDQVACFVASVSGTNVFRNLLSVVGGQLHVGSIINAGPVGYRDFDVEPNDAGGTYEPVDLQIDYARVGSAEITSDDTAVINHSTRIGALDADFSRVQATTPPYPSAPGMGAYALGVSRTDTVQIGHFRARNYNVWPLNLAFDWSSIEIGTFDVANCSLTDTTFNSMIVQQSNAGLGCIHIRTLICDAANTKRLATVAGTGMLKIVIDNVELWKGLIGNQITGRIANGIIDFQGSAGIAITNSSNVIFENINTTNYSSATFSSGCANLVGVNSSFFGSARDGVDMVVGGAVRIAGTKVLGNQQGLIGDVPTGGSATASSNATGINAILAALRAHGLIAT